MRSTAAGRRAGNSVTVVALRLWPDKKAIHCAALVLLIVALNPVLAQYSLLLANYKDISRRDILSILESIAAITSLFFFLLSFTRHWTGLAVDYTVLQT